MLAHDYVAKQCSAQGRERKRGILSLSPTPTPLMQPLGEIRLVDVNRELVKQLLKWKAADIWEQMSTVKLHLADS